eukprot:1161801-Pelagomonas_calceolata.AAC.6
MQKLTRDVLLQITFMPSLPDSTVQHSGFPVPLPGQMQVHENTDAMSVFRACLSCGGWKGNGWLHCLLLCVEKLSRSIGSSMENIRLCKPIQLRA